MTTKTWNIFGIGLILVGLIASWFLGVNNYGIYLQCVGIGIMLRSNF